MLIFDVRTFEILCLIYVNTQIHSCMHIHTYIHIDMHAFTHMLMYICIYMYTYTHTHIHTHIYAHIYVCAHVYVTIMYKIDFNSFLVAFNKDQQITFITSPIQLKFLPSQKETSEPGCYPYYQLPCDDFMNVLAPIPSHISGTI